MTRQGTRYYTRDMVGDQCAVCHLRVPWVLINVGIVMHPCCQGLDDDG